MFGNIASGIGSMFKESANESDALFVRFQVDLAKKYGEGGYGATYKAYDTQENTEVAVKIIDSRKMRQEAIVKECRVLEYLGHHENVISIKGHGPGLKSAHQEHKYFIFMELAGGGELFDQVIDNGAQAMSEDTARGFMRQILYGVKHCHERGVAHRDLKLENVLLTEQGVIKVIDFGLSHKYALRPDGTADRSTPLRDTCGSRSYAAPEVLQGRGYDGFAADVWSLGVCLFAMLSGFFPLDEATPKDWRFPKLQQTQRNSRAASTVAVVYGWYKRPVSHLTASVMDLMDRMLRINPAERITMEQVLAHPWVVNKVADPLFSGGPLSDQGTYNVHSIVEDSTEGPVWRANSNITGPGVQDIDMLYDEDDALPVYRSIGGASHVASDLSDVEPSMICMPGLARQAAFGGNEIP